MGLSTAAAGLAYDDTYDCGYITFGHFRMELAKTYNAELGDIYKRWCHGTGLTPQEIDRWNELCDEGLDLFLCHSDCDGKFTPKECRQIYLSIKDLTMDMMGHNYGTVRTYKLDGKLMTETKQYNMLEQWKNMFKHCYKRRVNLYFR